MSLVNALRRTLTCCPTVNAASSSPCRADRTASRCFALLDARAPQTPLVIAHLNHQLRGPDSDADERFIVELHATLAARFAPLHVEIHRCPVAEEAQTRGANLEAHARGVRYRWLAEVAQRHEMHWIATGHTANDQAETVLHRLLRGTGLQGLRGIRRAANWNPASASYGRCWPGRAPT